ncbi:MAG: protein kinase domain-containing protein, partial [Microcystaceae cyanobacterium]
LTLSFQFRRSTTVVLAEELKQEGVFNEQKIRSLLAQVLLVLQFVHANEIVHRDIKPLNLIRRRSDGKLVLVDFGAAKCTVGSALNVTGTVIGSAEFVAPEQLQGKATFASDLYSLGVTCIYLLTQVSPFDLYDSLEGRWVWRQYLNGNSVSQHLGKVLERLVETAGKYRYQNVTEVLEDLKNSQKNPSRRMNLSVKQFEAGENLLKISRFSLGQRTRKVLVISGLIGVVAHKQERLGLQTRHFSAQINCK